MTSSAKHNDILVLIPSISRNGGGVSEAARVIARLAASDLHARVRVLTLHDENYHRDITAWTVPVSHFRCFGPRRFGFSPGMLAYALSTRPACVHVHGLWMFHVLVGYLLKLRAGCKLVITPHGMLEPWIVSRSPILKWVVGKVFQNRALRRADCLHALTHREAEDIFQYSSPSSVLVIPNFLESGPEVPAGALPDWWSPRMVNKRILLYLGRIHEKKGVLELLEAWRQISESSPELASSSFLIFCGWIDSLPSFEHDVKVCEQLFSNVQFVGPQFGEQKKRSLGACSFFVLPSKSEGLPMAVLEAWAAGRPALLTDQCNLSTGFTSGAALEIHTSPTEMAAELSDALRLPERCLEQMGTAARKLVQREFSSGAVAGQFSKLYAHTQAKI